MPVSAWIATGRSPTSACSARRSSVTAQLAPKLQARWSARPANQAPTLPALLPVLPAAQPSWAAILAPTKQPAPPAWTSTSSTRAANFASTAPATARLAVITVLAMSAKMGFIRMELSARYASSTVCTARAFPLAPSAIRASMLTMLPCSQRTASPVRIAAWSVPLEATAISAWTTITSIKL
jgi:hypothetical protein